MKKILVSLPDNMHAVMAGREVSMSEIIRIALVQYLDLDPLTFEPRCANQKPVEQPEPTAPMGAPLPPFKSLPWAEQERIKDEFSSAIQKISPDEYCCDVQDSPDGYTPVYADMEPAD